MAKKAITGSLKSEDFLDFVAHELGLHLNPENVVVMDNLNIHRRSGMAELIAESGSYSRVFTTLLTRFQSN